MSAKPPENRSPEPTPGAKLRARLLLLGLGALVLAYVAAMVIRP